MIGKQLNLPMMKYGALAENMYQSLLADKV